MFLKRQGLGQWNLPVVHCQDTSSAGKPTRMKNTESARVGKLWYMLQS